jgi:2-polyprenyl-6-methoxyphenol hydroxylase-like FAD-dependent oxidoreductase
MAIVGAYVLAGEMATAATPRQAFDRYQAKLAAFASECQQGAADVGSFMAPKTRWGIRLRDLAFRAFDAVPGRGVMQRVVMRRATSIVLDDYASSGQAL